MTFGERICALRKEKKMTQEALAGALGVTNQAVSKWENGQSYPDIEQLPNLADLFEVTIDTLFGRTAPITAQAPAEPQEAPADLPWEDDDTLRIVVYLGRRLQGSTMEHELSVQLDGDVLNVECACDLNCDNVSGNIYAKGSVGCGDVAGDVAGGENVDCGDVSGHVQAGGNVDCGDVEGNIQATGNVDCGDVEGSVKAGGDVDCGDVEGNVQAGGSVDCGNVEGSVICRK